MITDAFLLIVASVIDLVLYPFRAISNVIPAAIQDGITWFFGFLNYGSGIFPVRTIYAATAFLLGVWVLKYVVRIVLFIFALLPWIGKSVDLPRSETLSVSSGGVTRRKTFLNR